MPRVRASPCCLRAGRGIGAPPLSVVLASVRHGGEQRCGLRVGGGCSIVLLQVVFYWSRDVEAGWRRRLSLWLCLEVDEGVLAGARGGVPADGRSKMLDSGFVPDESCGTQRSTAAIGLLLVLGVRFRRCFPLPASRRHRCSATASNDEVVWSKDLQGLKCILLFFQGSFALSLGQVTCGVELVPGCMLQMYLSSVF